MDKTISTRLSFLNKLSLVFLCALMADCCITGSGRMLMVGPVSVRMLLFGLTILTAVPSMLEQRRALLTNKLLWAFGAWLLCLVINAVVGVVKGNELSLIITDLKGFAYFALLPAAMCVLNDRNRVHILMKVMMYASGVLGVLLLLHLSAFLWAGETFMKLYVWGLSCNFSAMGRITATMPRLFFYSTNYLLVGCAFATYFQVVEKKIRPHLSLITGINLVGLLMSYTRSVYLAVAIAIFVLVVGFCLFLGKAKAKRFWTQIGLSLVAFCLVLSAFGIATKTDYVSYAVTRTLLSFAQPPEEVTPPDQTEPSVDVQTEPITEPITEPTVVDPETEAHQKATLESDQLRGNIIQELIAKIRLSPIFGHGLGAAIEWRKVNEYFFLDLTMKTGLVGLLLYMLPLLAAALIVFMHDRSMGEVQFQSAAWICVLLGFMAFSFFNPYMNAALGVLYYSCTLAAVNTVMKNKSDE